MPSAAALDERERSQLSPVSYDAKSERLVARATPKTKSLLERASLLEGRSLSDFILQKATEAAVKTIADYEVVILTENEREAFFNALLHPPAPSEKAMEAARRYREKMQQSG
jgi:uncharacterized protein (DUF1778 family)